VVLTGGVEALCGQPAELTDDLINHKPSELTDELITGMVMSVWAVEKRRRAAWLAKRAH
jgi:hypothetical protein